MKKSILCLIAAIALIQSTAAISNELSSYESPTIVCTSYNGKVILNVWEVLDDEQYPLRGQFDGYDTVYVGKNDELGVIRLEPEMKTMTGTIVIEGEGRFATLTKKSNSGIEIKTEFTCE